MTDKPFPPELRAWVTATLPAPHQVTDVSWPRSDSRVWRVAAGSTVAYVKLSPTALEFDREVTGYAYAARITAPHEAPRLLAADPDLKAILSSPLPGNVVRDLPLSSTVEPHVHQAAGRLLRRWHDHSDPATDRNREDAGAAMRVLAREAHNCLNSTAEHLSPQQRDLVHDASRELPRLADQLPVVYLHGDYSTRNWLWDAEKGHHGLVDFAMARYGTVIEEFVWLAAAVWAVQPDLRTAYLTGYGRPLTRAEERLLQLLTARLAVSYLNTGLVTSRRDLVDRGHLILNRITRTHL